MIQHDTDFPEDEIPASIRFEEFTKKRHNLHVSAASHLADAHIYDAQTLGPEKEQEKIGEVNSCLVSYRNCMRSARAVQALLDKIPREPDKTP